jgi:hypothetical protein
VELDASRRARWEVQHKLKEAGRQGDQGSPSQQRRRAAAAASTAAASTAAASTAQPASRQEARTRAACQISSTRVQFSHIHPLIRRLGLEAPAVSFRMG